MQENISSGHDRDLKQAVPIPGFSCRNASYSRVDGFSSAPLMLHRQRLSPRSMFARLRLYCERMAFSLLGTLNTRACERIVALWRRSSDEPSRLRPCAKGFFRPCFFNCRPRGRNVISGILAKNLLRLTSPALINTNGPVLLFATQERPHPSSHTKRSPTISSLWSSF